jgi:TDG/mug DNA glycosylase family protein
MPAMRNATFGCPQGVVVRRNTVGAISIRASASRLSATFTPTTSPAAMRSGQRQLLRLAEAGMFRRPASTYFEDVLTEAGIGLTDLVKRPTSGEGDVAAAELVDGRVEPNEKLSNRGVPLVVCVFRHPADAILDGPSRVGFQSSTTAWGAQLFRMPGPFAAAQLVSDAMQDLRDYWSRWINPIR